MFMLMPPLWPAIPMFLIASVGLLFVPVSAATGGYTVVTGGFGGVITPLVAAMALVAAAF